MGSLQRIHLPSHVDEELVARAVGAIRGGELVVLPTETVYGVAADPDCEAGVGRLRGLVGSATEESFIRHVASRDLARRLAGDFPPHVDGLLDRYWPGPLGVVVPSAGEAGTICLRWPAHDFTAAVIREFPQGLLLSAVDPNEPLVDPDEFGRRLDGRCEIVFDAGAAPIGEPSSIVDCTGPELRMLRDGLLSADDVYRTAGNLVLFVCTGNTCRSPLAEVIARDGVARALEFQSGDSAAAGLWFASAGIAAERGQPASAGSLQAAEEIGLDLGDHVTTQLTRELAYRAHTILCLGEAHSERVVEIAPSVADRIALIDPDQNIEDPAGESMRVYRRVRDSIAAAVDRRMQELLGLCRR